MKMNAIDVIESYVTDVAVALPRRQRNDVAYELRALINEGLQDKAEAEGRIVDAEMAIEFLRAFGRPEDVAARYRPALNIIDPADGHRFVRISLTGLLVIWSLGLLQTFSHPGNPQSGFLGALGQWWVHTVIPSVWWPGLLVVGFGMASWANRRWPQTSAWKPRAGDRIIGGRASMVMGLVGISFGLFVLANPHWLLDFFWGGRAAPAAYQALTYTDAFMQTQAPWLFALIMLNIPLLIAVIVKGRWSGMLRRAETALSLATCAAMLWTVLDGPILMVSVGDKTAKFLMALIVAMVLIHFAVKLHRTVRPSPRQQAEA